MLGTKARLRAGVAEQPGFGFPRSISELLDTSPSSASDPVSC